jgi:hypothetical protein
MERVASLEPAAQEIPCLSFRRCRINRHPLRRKPGAALEAPIGVFLGDPLPDALVADVFKQAPPYHLADLGLIICNKILCDTPDNFGDLVLPLLIPFRHFNLTPGQADDCRGEVRRRYFAFYVLPDRCGSS